MDTGTVSDQGDAVPQRIGDAERDRAAGLLRDHLAEGRLDQVEFGDRLTQALTARTAADLEPLFRDLPGPRPDSAVVPFETFEAPPWQQQQFAAQLRPTTAAAVIPQDSKWTTALSVMANLAWPLTLIALFATGWELWYLIFIPLCLSAWAGNEKKKRDELNGHQPRASHGHH